MTRSLSGGISQQSGAWQARIRAHFDHAQGYDGAATLQRVAARALAGDLARSMADRAEKPLRVLEIGCGTGLLTAQFCGLLPQAHIPVSYTLLRAHETQANLACRLLLVKKTFTHR